MTRRRGTSDESLGTAAAGSLLAFVGTVFTVRVLAVSVNAVPEIRRGGPRHTDPSLLRTP